MNDLVKYFYEYNNNTLLNVSINFFILIVYQNSSHFLI